MKTLIKLIIIFFTLHSQSYAQIIEKISIYGLNSISRGTALNYISFERGDFYDSDVKAKIVQSLNDTGFFKNIYINSNDNELSITFVENPSIKSVQLTMKSNNLIKKDALKSNMRSSGIYQGKIYNSAKFKEFIEKLKKTYIDNGYKNAIINYNVEINANNLASIDINIVENAAVKINSMNIIGAQSFDKSDLLDLFSIGESDNPITNFFTNRNKYSKIALDAGIQKIIDFYINNGYLDIKIEYVDVRLNDLKDSVDIEITIKENAIYYLGDIALSGNFNTDKDELRSLFTLKKNDIFTRKQIVLDLKSMRDYLVDKGHAFAKVKSSTNRRLEDGKNIIDLTINIETNKKVYINRIIINGNTRTQDNVVRRQIDLLEGGLYSGTELNKALSKIKRLGFFADVDMKILKVKGSEDRVDLQFNVTESKTGKLSGGIVLSNESGTSLNFGIAERNIFGTGNTLNAKLSTSKAVQNIDVFFLDPHWNQEGHSISYGIFSKKVNGSKLKAPSYIVNSFGVSGGYGIPISEYIDFNVNIRISKINISCGTTFAGANYEKEQCSKDYSNEVLSSIGLSKNSLNNYNFPTSGDSGNITLGLALPIADYRYYKLDLKYSIYHPISDKLTFNIKTKVGLGKGLGDQKLPFFKRYYGGGSSSVRGFNFNSLGEKYANGDVKGGNLSVLASASIISPIPLMKDSKNMRISAFIDAGGIFSKTNDFAVNQIRTSIGLAFIWLTPIGPIGVYTTKPIKYKTGDQTRTTGFTIGTTF